MNMEGYFLILTRGPTPFRTRTEARILTTNQEGNFRLLAHRLRSSRTRMLRGYWGQLLQIRIIS